MTAHAEDAGLLDASAERRRLWFCAIPEAKVTIESISVFCFMLLQSVDPQD